MMPKVNKGYTYPVDERRFNAMSKKISDLLQKHKNGFRNSKDFTSISSAIQIIKGIEYHYDNFLSLLKKYACMEGVLDDTPLDHEAVAYLNRLGQLWYFFRSKRLLDICPKIKELYLFRKKNTGHLSVHYSKGEKDAEQIWQAGALERRCWSGDLSTLSQ